MEATVYVFEHEDEFPDVTSPFFRGLHKDFPTVYDAETFAQACLKNGFDVSIWYKA